VVEWSSGIAASAPPAVRALALRPVVMVFLCGKTALERVLLRIADVVGIGELRVVPGTG